MANQFNKRGDCRFENIRPSTHIRMEFLQSRCKRIVSSRRCLAMRNRLILYVDSSVTRHLTYCISNNSLAEVWESGLPSFWVKQNMPQLAPKCFEKMKPQTTRVQKVPIRLQDLKGAFLVFAAGICLAFSPS